MIRHKPWREIEPALFMAIIRTAALGSAPVIRFAFIEAKIEAAGTCASTMRNR